MLLKIDVKPEDIIHNEHGCIIIRLRHFTAHAIAAHLIVADGQTKEDLDESRAKSSKNLFVGQRGGLSLK